MPSTTSVNQARRKPQDQTIDIAPLCIRADVGTVDKEARTVDLVFSTGAAVERYDWRTGGRYMEVLSLKPGHVRLGRLNGGAPLLDAHSAYSLSDQIGVVVSQSAKVTGTEGRATVRFSKRDSVEPVFQDVQDGIYRNVSVGYRVYKFAEDVADENKIPTRTAIDWEPYEISMVPMPADAGAQTRDGDKSQTNPCVIVTRSESKETTMREDELSETIAEENPLTPPATRTLPKEDPDETAIAVARERDRIQKIGAGCRAVRLPLSFANKLIDDQAMTLERAQTLILQEAAKRGDQDRGPASQPSGVSGTDLRVGDEDPLVHVRAGIQNALLHRIAPDRFKLDDESRKYRGMSLLDIGRAFLNARGTRTTHLDRSHLVDALIARSGLHTTTDFPSLLEDAANKTLRAAYDAAPQTWRAISKMVSLSDFKASRQLQVGDAPALLEILEHGEYTFGTIGEAKESITLKTYGRIFGITRQALINDDLNAFAEVPAAFGRKARDIESDLAWAQITTSPTMGDGNALFDATNHVNYTASGTAIDVTSLGVGRAALRKQKGIDGATLLNLTARYLIVPAGKETIADQYLTQITPALGTSVNPFSSVGGRTPLTPIIEPRLDVASATAWYMATDPAQAPVLYHGTLDGQEGPLVTQREGFNVDGIEFRCRIDVAFKAADWRAIYKNAGA